MKSKIRMMGSLFVLALSASALFSCSGKIESPNGLIPDLTPPTQDQFQNAITGPSLDGSWVSGCLSSWRQQDTWEVVTLKINGQSVVRHDDLYRDANCSQGAGSREETGVFRFVTKTAGGAFELEYRFNMPNGTYTQYENVLPEGQKLLISNEVGGDAEPQFEATRQ